MTYSDRLSGVSSTAVLPTLASLAFLPVLVPLAASAQTQARPELRAGILPNGFQLTGAVDDPAWQAADAIQNLTTTEPVEGGVPAGHTIVRVLAGSDDIVIGIVCEDADPDGIVSFSKARDPNFRGEDNIRIVLDTFLDGRSGYIFAVNPEGARFDALVTGAEQDNANWDAIWEAKTSRDSRGWSVEIKLPLKSLSFNADLHEWGFNIERRVQRLQETSRWAAARRDYRINQTNLAGLLTNLPMFDLGLGLSVRPAVVGEVGQPEIEASTDHDGELSLDVTQRIGSNLISSLTVNTDFAETEVDTRRTNLTRFPLFFPEKRTFFLEGADIFQFGSGREAIAFHSRRIGLLHGQEVPLVVGGKLNGRVANTNLGALIVRTGDVPDLATEATMGVLRVDQNIFAESSVGMIATFGDPENRQGAWTAGADFTYRTSHFRGDRNFVAKGWGLTANRDDLEGDSSAFGLLVDYPNVVRSPGGSARFTTATCTRSSCGSSGGPPSSSTSSSQVSATSEICRRASSHRISSERASSSTSHPTWCSTASSSTTTKPNWLAQTPGCAGPSLQRGTCLWSTTTTFGILRTAGCGIPTSSW